ncbi:MAG: PocR ligand-binding domain-containing protein [Anaerolineales bacterium]|jgi:excisionase family DNA binding protein
MTELLTAKQVQKLLNVDRTTIYRMLKDGRLEGIKVGSHWRFRQEEIDKLLSLTHDAEVVDSAPTEILPLHCIQSIQNVFSQIAEVGAVVTDMEGQPLSEMSHCSRFCELIQDSPAGHQACLDSWKELAQERDTRPIFHSCHAGLRYARGFIMVEDKPSAMIVAGQFYLNQPDPEERDREISRLAEEYGIDRAELLKAAADLPVLDERKQAKIATWIAEVAETFGDISTERAEMLRRLKVISEMSSIHKS